MFARVRLVGRVWLLAVMVMMSIWVATVLRAQSTELEVVQSENTDLAHAAAVLQALKDLEFERSVGKIAEADYEEIVGRYRAEAKRLLRAVDEDLGPLRERASAYVAEQLGTERPPKRSKLPKKAAGDPVCPSCRTENDADAAFCKKCGNKLGDTSKDTRNATG